MRQKTSSMGAGIISGKGFLDRDLIAEWMANADNKNLRTYPGGSRDENHDANPGAMSMGLKCVRTDQHTEGSGSQLGVVGIGGLARDHFVSHRSMEGQFVFQGFCATSERVGKHHMDANTMETGNGYATIQAGVANAPNNGPHMIYANDLLCWQIPALGDLYGHHRPMEGNEIIDSGIINQRNRNGDPSGQFRFELAPFDPRDMTMHTAGAIANMGITSDSVNDGGIQGMKFSEFFEFEGSSDTPQVSCQAEEAAGRKFGYTGVGLSFVETLAQRGWITINQAPVAVNDTIEISRRVQKLSGDIGLWDTSVPVETPIWYEAIQNMFFMNAFGAPNVTEIKQNFTGAFGKSPKDAGLASIEGNNPDSNYQKLRVHLSRFTDGALIGSWYDKLSKIVGRAQNTGAEGDMIHVITGQCVT